MVKLTERELDDIDFQVLVLIDKDRRADYAHRVARPRYYARKRAREAEQAAKKEVKRRRLSDRMYKELRERGEANVIAKCERRNKLWRKIEGLLGL